MVERVGFLLRNPRFPTAAPARIAIIFQVCQLRVLLAVFLRTTVSFFGHFLCTITAMARKEIYWVDEPERLCQDE